MPPKHLWVWKIYLLFMLFLVIKKVYHLVNPDSPYFFYYFFLRTFDPVFNITYIAYVLQVFLSALNWIPLFLYVHRIHSLPAEFWRMAFILRSIFEIPGHGYEMNALTALYHKNPKFCLMVFIIIIIPYIPSYVACYWYAFRQEKALTQN